MKYSKDVRAALHINESAGDPWAPVEAAFDRLDTALLEAAAADPANAQNLRQVAAGISVLKSLLLDSIQ